MMFFHVWGGTPLGAPQAPPKLEKPCRGQNCACGGWQGSWGSKKLLAQEFFFIFFFNFFWGIFNSENKLFSKGAKKWSSFRKKLIYFFPLLGGGGSRPNSGNFWTLPLHSCYQMIIDDYSIFCIHGRLKFLSIVSCI